jgi:ATP-dependent RNA helicase RhlE
MVATDCDSTPVPFTSLGLDPRLLEGIRDLGFQTTRPIQSAVIPLALAGRDLIACAETGTGKTAAFVLPMLQWLITAGPKTVVTSAAEAPQEVRSGRPADASRGGNAPVAQDLGSASQAVVQDFSPASQTRDFSPASQAGVARPASQAGVAQDFSPAISRHAISRVLVLAPTRELAVQIEDEIHGLSYHTPVTSAAVYGGVAMDAQERALRAGVDIIVATPGRLMDHMRQQNADLSGIELLVLDEADRMMDMGFWPDVQRIISAVPKDRQTLLFSATIPDEVVRQTGEILREPLYVQVGTRSAVAKSITHEAHAMPASAKLQWLIEHLRRPAGPVLVFTRMKVGAERLTRQLSAAGIRAAALHADRTQDQRRAAVEGFRGGKYKVLVATDIAARGLDIDGIHTVINYEVPDSPESYVHRVGRTGRADEAGHAITLVAPDERSSFAAVEKSVGIRLECGRNV